MSTAGGHRRFLFDSLQEFAKAHGISIGPEAVAGDAKPLRVLLVDDDPIFTEYLREIVRGSRIPVQIQCAADGFEAGQLTEAFRPDLVALDINMPRIDGIELCRRLRASAATAKSRLVILSSSLSPDNIDAARKAGADAWLEKGTARTDILRALGLPTAHA